jgi:hypothetical protein
MTSVYHCPIRYSYNVNDGELLDGELYGVHETNMCGCYTIKELMKQKNFDNIEYLYLSGPDETKYKQDLNFKYPKCLRALVIYNYKHNDIYYPDELPIDLTHLTIKGSRLPILPPNLIHFSCDMCRFDESFIGLPDLPDSIELFDCSKNIKITKLPKLPIKLKELRCNECSITELPKLPNGLTTLQCHYNKLKKLPRLPSSIKLLNCSYNDIEELPLSSWNCDMSLGQYEIGNSKKSDKFKHFIYEHTPIHHYINNNYYVTKNGHFKKIKKAPQRNKIGYYLKTLRFVKYFEPIYMEARYNPQYGLCQHILKKQCLELYGEDD